MEPLSSDSFQEIAAQVQIREVLHRYAFSLDSRDFVTMRSCFTPNVTAVYNGIRVEGGVDGIVQLLRGLFGFVSTMHFVGTTLVDRVGDQADVLSYAVAHLVSQDSDGPFMLRRGVRYEDRMVRVDREWRISRRNHIAVWSIRSSVVLEPTLPREFGYPDSAGGGGTVVTDSGS